MVSMDTNKQKVSKLPCLLKDLSKHGQHGMSCRTSNFPEKQVAWNIDQWITNYSISFQLLKFMMVYTLSHSFRQLLTQPGPPHPKT